MKIRIKYALFFLLLAAIESSSCKKYLSEKPMKSAVVPKTMEDLEALLNQRSIVEASSAVNEIVADDYYVEIEDWQYLLSRSVDVPAYFGECLSYNWDTNAMHKSWIDVYTNPVHYSNVVLDIAKDIKTNDEDRLNRIRGAALFYRSFAFERLAQVYCNAYSLNADKDFGLVLRLTSDINAPTKRSTLQETYDQIIKDLKKAAELLPIATEFPTHPTQAAAYGTLARVYLSMRDYPSAGYYANLCLQINGRLMDYNNINPLGKPVFKEYNDEVIFHNRPIPPGILAASRAKINVELYESYEANDLRKSLFFLSNSGAKSGSYSFRGAYLGRLNSAGNAIFDGITTGEMYLVRAESFARMGNKESALKDLNILLINRMDDREEWRPVIASDANEALEIILKERRKELVMRGLRWTDLRRLNEEGANITLIRVLDDINYTLPPGDLRWTLLIPESVIERSNIEQNLR